MLETSHVRCFVAVAEELHFGRAAARLNMTQPPLSRQIQLLEHAIGCTLFNRTSRSVELTSAGRTFLPDAQRILRILDNATTATREVARGSRGAIRCGFTAASAYRFLPNHIRAVKQAIPDISLILREMVSSQQIAALDAGEIDIGFLRPPFDSSIFDHRLVARESLLLALPHDHELAKQSFARWSDLNDIDMIMYDSREGRYFYELVTSHFVQNNVYPRYRQSLAQVHTILSLVRAGIGVAVVPSSARVLEMSDIVYREIVDGAVPQAVLNVVWRRSNSNPLIPLFADVAVNQFDHASD